MQIQIFNTPRSSFSIYLLSKPVLIKTRLSVRTRLNAVLAAVFSQWHSGMVKLVRRRSFTAISCHENSMSDSTHSEDHVLKCMEKIEK